MENKLRMEMSEREFHASESRRIDRGELCVELVMRIEGEDANREDEREGIDRKELRRRCFR